MSESHIDIVHDYEGDLILHTYSEGGTSCGQIYDDFLNLGLARGQSASIVFDTAKKTYTVEKSLKCGWYGIRLKGNTYIAHFDGQTWSTDRRQKPNKRTSYFYLNRAEIEVITKLIEPSSTYLTDRQADFLTHYKESE